ncbi:unnamed protein product [Chrysodeixis includens]|uniref:Uncharacterized protein n=1 Tax=Chrysodeixis includens TaxID=689277 RepID=A0A9N8KZY0_CHRIL|nr:unnamed protein product [Chrysodeixis includens]
MTARTKARSSAIVVKERNCLRTSQSVSLASGALSVLVSVRSTSVVRCVAGRGPRDASPALREALHTLRDAWPEPRSLLSRWSALLVDTVKRVARSRAARLSAARRACAQLCQACARRPPPAAPACFPDTYFA